MGPVEAMGAWRWVSVCAALGLLVGCGADGGGQEVQPVQGEQEAQEAQVSGREQVEERVSGEVDQRREAGDVQGSPDVPVEMDLTAFVPAPVGCSQAHCDAELSDQANLPAPGAGAQVLLRDEQAPGSNYALGCSSNGERVACAYGGVAGLGPYLVVYNASGQRLWSSDEMAFTTFTSAPAIDAQGGVIAADAQKMVRFGPEGGVLWRFTLPEGAGAPVSPVITSRGFATFATTGGLVGSVDTRTGQGHTLRLEETLVGDRRRTAMGTFVTRNTPVARSLEGADRIYITTEFSPDSEVEARAACLGKPARFYALDVDEEGALSVAWFTEVGGRAGASPTVSGDVIFFDADRLDAFGPEGDGLLGRCTGQDAPHFFAIRDLGDRGEFVYKHPLTSPDVAPSGEAGAVASAARDPEGGLWLFALESGALVRLSETASATQTTYDGSPTAEVMEVLDFGDVFPEAQPSSAITIAQGRRGPVGMMTFADLGDTQADFETRWVAFDLRPRANGAVRVNTELVLGEGYSDWSAAQSPVALDHAGRPRVFLSTFSKGLAIIGQE